MNSAETQEHRKLQPENWVDCYGDLFYRYVVSRVRDGELAEELVQQTFLSGLANRGQFAGVGSEKSWLMSILKRKLIDHIRSRRRVVSLDHDDESGDPLDQFFDRKGRWRRDVRDTLLRPLDSIDREEFWPIFQLCMAALPEKQADAFLLREVDERKTEEICKELEISTSNLWVLLHRARLRLANCMKRRWLSDND